MEKYAHTKVDPLRFKHMLLKSQLYITKINWTFFPFLNVTTRNIYITDVVRVIFLLDCDDPEGRDKRQERGSFSREGSSVAGD